jgi:hypothetical protein
MKGLEKICAGLYEFTSIKHRGCGGTLRVDRCGRRGEFLWETYCMECLTCDANGYATLRESVDVVTKNKGVL